MDADGTCTSSPNTEEDQPEKRDKSEQRDKSEHHSEETFRKGGTKEEEKTLPTHIYGDMSCLLIIVPVDAYRFEVQSAKQLNAYFGVRVVSRKITHKHMSELIRHSKATDAMKYKKQHLHLLDKRDFQFSFSSFLLLLVTSFWNATGNLRCVCGDHFHRFPSLEC